MDVYIFLLITAIMIGDCPKKSFSHEDEWIGIYLFGPELVNLFLKFLENHTAGFCSQKYIISCFPSHFLTGLQNDKMQISFSIVLENLIFPKCLPDRPVL